ncbi:hypothetical protein D9M72_241050 [compost metagenome]
MTPELAFAGAAPIPSPQQFIEQQLQHSHGEPKRPISHSAHRPSRMAGFTVFEPMEIRMLIKRILVAITLMFGALHAHAASDGTDSHCVVGKNNSLFNQCNYSVDVGFCVENPQQTKHFYDNSKAFECPGGALIALPAGLQDGNILHGKVHWWACSIKHRAGNKWRYVEGVGYRGYCFKEGANQAQPVRNSAPAAPTATADCQALENRLQGPNPTTHQMRRAQALTALEYVDRNCGGQSPQQRARVRKASQETLIAAAAECKQSGGRNCDSSNDIPESRSTAQRPEASSSSSPPPERKDQSSNSDVQRALSLSDCVPEQKAYRAAMFAKHGDTLRELGTTLRTEDRVKSQIHDFVRENTATSRQRLLDGIAFIESRRALSPPGSFDDVVNNINVCYNKVRLGVR